MTASSPIGSLKGSTMTSAPAARAALTAWSMSVTRYPVRSCPNGKGTGVWYAKTDSAPTGVNMYCISVLLATGRTFPTIRLDGLPPNVATKLLTNGVPTSHAEQEGVHQDEFCHVGRKLRGVSVRHHEADVVAHYLRPTTSAFCTASDLARL